MYSPGRTCDLVLGHCDGGVPVGVGVGAHVSVLVCQGGQAVGRGAAGGALDRPLGLGLEVRGSALDVISSVLGTLSGRGQVRAAQAGA